MVTAIVFAITYGVKIESLDHEYVLNVQIAMEGLVKSALPGTYWVDFFPFLQHIPSWVPFTGARRLADKYMPYVIGSREKPYRHVQAAMVRFLFIGGLLERFSSSLQRDGTALPSITQDIIQEIDRLYGGTAEALNQEEIAKCVTGTAYASTSALQVRSRCKLIAGRPIQLPPTLYVFRLFLVFLECSQVNSLSPSDRLLFRNLPFGNGVVSGCTGQGASRARPSRWS